MHQSYTQFILEKKSSVLMVGTCNKGNHLGESFSLSMGGVRKGYLLCQRCFIKNK